MKLFTWILTLTLGLGVTTSSRADDHVIVSPVTPPPTLHDLDYGEMWNGDDFVPLHPQLRAALDGFILRYDPNITSCLATVRDLLVDPTLGEATAMSDHLYLGKMYTHMCIKYKWDGPFTDHQLASLYQTQLDLLRLVVRTSVVTETHD